MIYVTGDTHGGIDMKKLYEKEVVNQLTENDYLIICGDFGFIWNKSHESSKEKTWLEWFHEKKWTTLFVDGNHENFTRLYTYPEKEWHGGKVHVIRDNVLHLMRGQLFNIDGNRIFALGGASSHDRGPMAGEKNASGWWKEELPSRDELQEAGRTLNAANHEVDYVITHCLPTSLQSLVTKGKFKPDILTEYLEGIRTGVQYKHWYCGHYHVERDLDNNISIIFNRVIKLGELVESAKPMCGHPCYARKEEVIFHYKGADIRGIITTVFPFGSFRQKEQPSYNIQITEPGKTGVAIQIVESDIISRS